jgi:hypothetical protein
MYFNVCIKMIYMYTYVYCSYYLKVNILNIEFFSQIW